VFSNSGAEQPGVNVAGDERSPAFAHEKHIRESGEREWDRRARWTVADRQRGDRDDDRRGTQNRGCLLLQLILTLLLRGKRCTRELESKFLGRRGHHRRA
jgi:hypothetical protein